MKLSYDAKRALQLIEEEYGEEVLKEIMNQKIEQEEIDTNKVHKHHFTLLKNAYWRYEDCEFGAIAMDCKRPYGNSDVISDIRELTGSTASSDTLCELHERLGDVIRVVFENPDKTPNELIGDNL